MMSHTLVIAEAGSCHDRRILACADLIDVAVAANANAVKFQYWSSPAKLAARRNAEDYLPVYQKYALPLSWIEPLKTYCDSKYIEFMCTVYLPEDIATITPFVKRFKVASFEAGDREFIDAHREYDKEIIVSTGMMEMDEAPEGVSLLHCVSSYPTPLEQANLSALGSYDLSGASWLTPVTPLFAGYSDHTHNVLTGALAVAAGARILEVHFRLDDTDPANPDYATALSPGQLKDYIALVRQAEVMMGDGVKVPQPAEEAMMKYRVRK